MLKEDASEPTSSPSELIEKVLFREPNNKAASFTEVAVEMTDEFGFGSLFPLPPFLLALPPPPLLRDESTSFDNATDIPKG